jgi:hypothetical protein
MSTMNHAPLQALREIDVPVGARVRIRARIEAEIDRTAAAGPPRSMRTALVIAAVTATAVFAIVMLRGSSSDSRALAVAPGDRVDLAVEGGRVSLSGPAEIVVEPQGLALSHGTLHADGRLHVRGPSCEVAVDGSAEVSVRGVRMTVQVFAGSAQIVKPSVTCDVLAVQPAPTPRPTNRETSPAKPAVSMMPRPAAPPAVKHVLAVSQAPRAAKSDPATQPTSTATEDPLADAVASYKLAVAMERTDPAGAASAWYAWRDRWRDCPLAHAADLRLLAVLGRLDRQDDVARVASEFLHRYPDSPRRADVERLLGGPR